MTLNANDEEDDMETGPVVWMWSSWEILGITSHTVSNVFQALGNGALLFAREFQAAANYSRHKRVQRQYEAERAKVAQSLEGLVDGKLVDRNILP